MVILVKPTNTQRHHEPGLQREDVVERVEPLKIEQIALQFTGTGICHGAKWQ